MSKSLDLKQYEPRSLRSEHRTQSAHRTQTAHVGELANMLANVRTEHRVRAWASFLTCWQMYEQNTECARGRAS